MRADRSPLRFTALARAAAVVALAAAAAAACAPSAALTTDDASRPGSATTVTTPEPSRRPAPAPSPVPNGAPAETAPSSTSTSSTSSTSSSTTTTTTPKPMDDKQLSAGEKGPEIALLQLRLFELGYRPGTTDGSYGPATVSAVMAFQKREGLARDGTAGPEVIERLKAPSGAGPLDASGGPRIEVDLDRQIAFVTINGVVSTINVSTGSGETYSVPGTNGTAVAYTPTGSYRVGLRINGPENGKLGVLYRPLYFTGGWAVHGSTSVPAYPASHGCVRTSYADQDWLFDQFPSGSSVVVHRGGVTTQAPITAGDTPGD